MKKNLVLAGIILSVVVLAVLSVVTAIRIKNLGTQPVAPSAPKSKPKAEEVIPLVTPAAGCRVTFGVATPTPTATSTPCPIKIQGRVYRDRSPQADYRVSDTEEYGPVVFRVDYQPDGQNMIINGGNKACVDSCSPSCAVNFANGSFATGSLNSGKYAVRLYLNSADWVVTEAYLSNGTACKANKAGNVAVSGLNTQTAYISKTDYACGTYNIWFGVKPKAETTVTPTPTGTLTPTPTGTQAPTPTNTPVPTATNTPVPTATNTPPPGFAQEPTSTPVYRAAVEPTPTEVLLPKAGLKIPTFGGLIMGFLLISLGAALIF